MLAVDRREALAVFGVRGCTRDRGVNAPQLAPEQAGLYRGVSMRA